VIVVFTVYLDESGSPDDTAAVVVAGFIATIEQWIPLELCAVIEPRVAKIRQEII
jgi:hypothetical protein